MHSGLPYQQVTAATLGCVLTLAASCHIVAALEDHEPMPSPTDAEAADAPAEPKDAEAFSSPETVCNHADDDGDGLVDDGLAWQVAGWQTLLKQAELSEITSVSLPAGRAAFATRTAPAHGTSSLLLGVVDETGSLCGEIVPAVENVGIEGWGLAFDTAHQQLILAFVESSHRELHLARFHLDEPTPRLISTEAVALEYPVSELLDVGWTEFGPVVLVKGTDHYARAEWTDHLNDPKDWNHKLISIKPDVAKLSVGTAVAWVASGTLDAGQQGVMGGVLALDGRRELRPGHQLVKAGGGVWPKIFAPGIPLLWQQNRVWLTTTDEVKASKIWNIRISFFDSTAPASTLASPGTMVDSLSTDPMHAHSLVWALGSVLSTTAAKDQVRDRKSVV